MARKTTNAKQPDAEDPDARGVNEEWTFTVRDSTGHRIDPVSREKVPRGYDIATRARYRDDEIVPFDPKIDRRKK